MESIVDEVKFKGDLQQFITFLRKDPQFYAKTPEELLKHATNYLKHLLDDSNETKSEELISLNHLTNLVNLTDDEKIKFIGLQESKKNEFLINKFKFMMILLTQEKMVDQNFYLN